jgi:hypothetical protein
MITACGGGVAPTTFSGTAADGAALANAAISARDSKGATRTTTANANGTFSVDVTGMMAPLIIRATSVDGSKTYYSITQTIPANGVVNVTTITDLLARASGQTPSTIYADPVAKFPQVDFARITVAQTNLKTALGNYMQALSIPSSDSLITSAFSTDHTKVDALLDCLTYSFEGILFVKSACTGDNDRQAFDPATDVANVPAVLPAPKSGALSYITTNLPLISSQIKRLSDANSGVSGDLRTILNDIVDDNSIHGEQALTKAQFIDREVASYASGTRITFYPGALVGVTDSTIDMCVYDTNTENGATWSETLGQTFKKNPQGVWQNTTKSDKARASCEKDGDVPGVINIRAVAEYGNPGPLVSSLYSSYVLCVGKAPKLAIGVQVPAVPYVYCGAPGASTSAASVPFDVSNWTPASGTITLVAYIKDVASNTIFGAEDGGGVVTLDSAGNLSHSDLSICARDATGDSVSCAR